MCFGFVELGALFRRISKSVQRKPLTNAASSIRDQDFFSDPRGYRYSAELRQRLDFGFTQSISNGYDSVVDKFGVRFLEVNGRASV